jgi:hypothetical protein
LNQRREQYLHDQVDVVERVLMEASVNGRNGGMEGRGVKNPASRTVLGDGRRDCSRHGGDRKNAHLTFPVDDHSVFVKRRTGSAQKRVRQR